jgi:HEAT repeat protein
MNERMTVPAAPTPAALIRAMRNPDPFARADALERAGTAQELVPIFEQVLGDDYPLVRREAVRALSRIGGRDAVRALLWASAHDVSAEVREEAVSALAGMLRRRDGSTRA